jgi:hypothetical protein
MPNTDRRSFLAALTAILTAPMAAMVGRKREPYVLGGPLVVNRIGEITPAATVTVHASADGGETWRELGPPYTIDAPGAARIVVRYTQSGFVP